MGLERHLQDETSRGQAREEKGRDEKCYPDVSAEHSSYPILYGGCVGTKESLATELLQKKKLSRAEVPIGGLKLQLVVHPRPCTCP